MLMIVELKFLNFVKQVERIMSNLWKKSFLNDTFYKKKRMFVAENQNSALEV